MLAVDWLISPSTTNYSFICFDINWKTCDDANHKPKAIAHIHIYVVWGGAVMMPTVH